MPATRPLLWGRAGCCPVAPSPIRGVKPPPCRPPAAASPGGASAGSAVTVASSASDGPAPKDAQEAGYTVSEADQQDGVL